MWTFIDWKSVKIYFFFDYPPQIVEGCQGLCLTRRYTLLLIYKILDGPLQLRLQTFCKDNRSFCKGNRSFFSVFTTNFFISLYFFLIFLILIFLLLFNFNFFYLFPATAIRHRHPPPSSAIRHPYPRFTDTRQNARAKLDSR